MTPPPPPSLEREREREGGGGGGGGEAGTCDGEGGRATKWYQGLEKLVTPISNAKKKKKKLQ